MARLVRPYASMTGASKRCSSLFATAGASAAEHERMKRAPECEAPSIGVALTAAAVPLWMHLSLLEECHGRAKQALTGLEAGMGRDARREMKLHAAVGASLTYTTGDAAHETGATWTKALEIAESLDDPQYQLRSLWG